MLPLKFECVGRDNSVSIATGYGLEGPEIESRWGGRGFSTCPDRPWDPSCLLYNGYRVLPGGKETGELLIMQANDRWDLTRVLGLILLTWRIRWDPNNASRWQMGFSLAFKGLKFTLTLILLTWRIWWAPNNASRWQMGFSLAFKGLNFTLTLTLLTWKIWWAPNNASNWQMGFNSAFKPYPANVENMVSS